MVGKINGIDGGLLEKGCVKTMYKIAVVGDKDRF